MARHSLLWFSMVLSAPNSMGKVQGQTTCGASTYLNNDTNQCLPDCPCSGDVDENPNIIRLVGIMDYSWAPDLFAVTVQLINEGFWPGTLKDGEVLEYDFRDDMCDETEAVREYWSLRTQNTNVPPHGIVGCRCSGASTSLARVSGLEAVPQLSPASNAQRLSDDSEFPFFSRLVAPNNEDGEVGVLVAALREFGWKRVTVLATDTVFANDLAREFKKLWVGGDGAGNGVISYSDTIRLDDGGDIDLDSVREVLEGVPTHEPSINSRIIFLASHHQHAFKILQHANQINFQEDTVWVGTSAWIGRSSSDTDLTWLPDTPGYLGVAPARNHDTEYLRFLERFHDVLPNEENPVANELPLFGAETVDSIVTLTKAISDNGVDGRRDGKGIVGRLRQTDFAGVSGRVQLTEQGDRKNPRYSILNAQTGETDKMVWIEVGSTGINSGPLTFTKRICFAVFGCVAIENAPPDSYADPPEPLPWWVAFLIVVFALLFLVALLMYFHSRRSKTQILEELERFRESIVGMRVAEHDYVPVTGMEHVDIEAPSPGKVCLDHNEQQAFSQYTVVWCWKETKHCMDVHGSDDVFGDPKECWIKYDTSIIDALEAAYQKKQRDLSIPGYFVDFRSMKQTKTTTGFVRDVQRQVVSEAVPIGQVERRRNNETGDLGVEVGDALPDDLLGEPRMVLVKGDVVQISSERHDGWAFGTKLHHADEARARELLDVANNKRGAFDDDDEAAICTDSGWFEWSVTRAPLSKDVSFIRKNVGDAGELSPPETWDVIVNPTVVQKHPLKEDDEERDAVERAFMRTVCPPHFGALKIINVERVQNLAMWQSYVVKRQTICYRETGHITADDEAQQRKALERFERRWLWHGSSADAVDKILQQGFNRSFCGKNATVYGKGVYFARDAAYSARPLYSVPDDKGYQYMMACRVVVGEYCRGERDAVTPDVRDSTSQSLFDTTVDKVASPSIYVTYHDAQAYPEYLVTFKVQNGRFSD